VRYERTVEITGHAPGAEVVQLLHGHQLIATDDLRDGRWRLTVPARVLGMGEVRLQVRALFTEGQGVRSPPLTIRVSEPARLPAAAIPKPDAPGLLALVDDDQGGVRELRIDKLGGRLKALEHGGPPPARIRLRGYLKVEQSGTYQLALRSKGRLQLRLHDQLFLDKRMSPGDVESFVALGLEAGWHPLEIVLQPDGRKPSLRVVLAGQTAPALLAGSNLGHHAAAAAD
jgi:hypothetical protein